MADTIRMAFLRRIWPQALGTAMMAAPVALDLSHAAAIAIFGAGLVVGIGGLIVEVVADSGGWRNRLRLKTKHWSALLFGTLILGCAAWYFWPPAAPWKHTLEDLYASDFRGPSVELNRIDVVIRNKNLQKGAVLHIRFRLYSDFTSDTDFVSLFIPLKHDGISGSEIFSIIKSLRDQIPKERNKIRSSLRIGESAPGIRYTDTRNMKFSGRVFIYTLEPFTDIQRGQLVSWYQKAGMSLQIRGNDYWWANRNR